MIKNCLEILIACIAFFCLTITLSEAVTYNITIIDTLGGDASTAEDLNNRCQIVGSSLTKDGFSHAFLWEKGVMSDLGALPEDSSSGARSINNEGSVLVVGRSGDGPVDAVLWNDGIPIALGLNGWAEDINDKRQIVGGYLNDQAWLWDSGNITYLGTLVQGQEAVAKKINNSGQVVGYATTAPYIQQAFMWEDGNIGTLENLPGPFSQALGINDQGVVVGLAGAESPNICYPFVWENGSVTWIGEEFGRAIGINNKGQAVGLFNNSGGGYHEHAFIWDAIEGFRDLNDLLSENLNWDLASAAAINERGQIVGTAKADIDQDGRFETTRGFLLTPIPTIEEILDFFIASIIDNKVEGSGKGCHSFIKLWMFGQLLESTKFFIDNGMASIACETLNQTVLRCDGEPWPKDLINGEAVSELRDMIILLMEGLGCD